MFRPPTIWIVDDDATVRFTVGRLLTREGYEVVECEGGAAALARLEIESPALVLLDVDMPRMDGWQTLSELRRRGCAQPVLMFTHADDIESKVRGFDVGADDYIGKTVDPRELLARVAALLRRAKPGPAEVPPIVFEDVRIDLQQKTATKGGDPLKLTRTDYALLRLLRLHSGRPVSRDQIMTAIWGMKSGNTHALDTHLWRLRKKLGDSSTEPRLIRNITGLGYTMELPSQGA